MIKRMGMRDDQISLFETMLAELFRWRKRGFEGTLEPMYARMGGRVSLTQTEMRSS